MIFPPGKGQSGQHLMHLWRDYLEQYADREGDVEGQAIVAAYKAVEVLASFSGTLDKNSRYADLINHRNALFKEGSLRADSFVDCTIHASFSIYNCLNTLSYQLTEGNAQAIALIQKVDKQVHQNAESADPVERAAAALRAVFPLLGLVTIALDCDQAMIGVIRKVEKRFVEGANASSSSWEHLLNALYRAVEMMQIFALLSDSDLEDQINQIAARFQEEDQQKELRFKLRNGFCRLFELGHLLATQVDAML